MPKQVDREVYRFEKYCGIDRWSSYHYQLREILALSPKSVLEVGKGDGVVGRYLKDNAGIEYRSMDIAEDLHPDIVGDIERIPLADGSVDVAVAFEVLEHIPFDRFHHGLDELARIAKDRVIISLPHYGPSLRFNFKIPMLGEIKRAWKLPHHPMHRFNGQHHWEIGKKGYELPRIIDAISGTFDIEREYVPYENQYHHFFVLRSKKHSANP